MSDEVTWDTLYRVAWRLLVTYPDMPYEDKEDFAQAAVCRYWEKKEEIEYPKAYVTTTTRNMVIDAWRKKQTLPLMEWDPDRKSYGWEDRVLHLVSMEEHVSRLDAMLTGPEREFLSVFVDHLSFTSGASGRINHQTFKHTAKDLGISSLACRQRMTRIRQKAKDIVAERPVRTI